MKIILSLLFSILIISTDWLSANNVQVTNVIYDNATARVTFDLSWENSWRRDGAIPDNYDGIWVFVKVRECTEKNLGNPAGFTHAWLSTAPADHAVSNSAPNGEVLTVEPATTNIGGTDRGMGVFIYRAADGGTSNLSTTVTLQWEKAAQAAEMAAIDAADDYDVKVFGIEMVYIPQAAFYAGDGGSNNCFHDATGGTGVPYQVTSEAAFNVSGTFNRALNDAGGTAINASFPKGYDSFWIMKYEISQGEYAAFLNTLTLNQAESRTEDELFSLPDKRYVMLADNADPPNRQAICFDPTGDPRTQKFGTDLNDNGILDEATDGQGIACNYLNLRDVMAYLDWAALRPLTELEYEKTCRGTLGAILEENAWGTAEELKVTAITNSGAATEVAANNGNGLCNYGGAVGSDPMRCGYAATASTNRPRAGAAYYGVMDMSGNVHEPYVSFFADPANSNNFDGSTGDGELDATGFQNVTGWPAHASDADINHFLAKGGNNNRGEVHLRISDRQNDNNSNYRYTSAAYMDSRNQYGGGRGGR